MGRCKKTIAETSYENDAVVSFCHIDPVDAECRYFSDFRQSHPTTPKILFTSARDGNREIYMMNPDGSEQVNLTQHPASDMSAAWSPTGEQILFVSDRQGTRVREPICDGRGWFQCPPRL